MRQELKRIETMLAHLATQNQRDPAVSTSLSTVTAQTRTPAAMRSPSLDMPSTALSSPTPRRPKPALPTPAIAATAALNVLVQPVLADLNAVKTPTLPKLSSPAVTQPHPIADPSSAVTRALKAVETVATGWQEELRQILQQIQTVYREGPIIDGWLEAYASDQANPSVAQQSSSVGLKDGKQGPMTVTLPGNTSDYRLCGLNENGQLWFRHCPAAQVPAVSLAIARHQSLKQLLIRKQNLELQLTNLAKALTMV